MTTRDSSRRERSVEPRTGSDDAAAGRVLLIGDGPLADSAARALEGQGAQVARLLAPSDREIREAIDEHVDRALIISRYDHVALRRALVLAQLRPGVPVVVTIFDRDVARSLQSAADNVHVLSTADVVAPAFAGPCLDPELASLLRDGTEMRGVGLVAGSPEPVRPTWSTPGTARRLLANVETVLRPFDSSARILVYGLLGFLAVLVAETVVARTTEHLPLLDAFYTAAKVTVTIGPNEAADHGPDWVKIFSALTMLCTVGFAAVLTAGLINRLLDPRLTGLTGRSAVPRRDHVIVVGLGQVGLRLCGMLRDAGVSVVAVEANAGSKNVPRARDQRFPVVIGSGADQRVLRRLSVRKARAIAAVTSDEIENIAVAVAARGLSDELNIVLRAGDGDVTSEVQSLFGIGVVRDVQRLAGAALAAAALGQDPHQAFPGRDALYLELPDGRIEPASAA